MRNCITIFTDASVCMQTYAGGWGAWVKYGLNQKLEASGSFKEIVSSATEAELRAIANGIYVATKRLYIADKTLFCVVTDSQNAIGILERVRKNLIKRDTPYVDIVKTINGLIPPTCTLSVRKVKAHVSISKSDKRNYVNNLVDKLAKSGMKEKRRLLMEEAPDKLGSI